MSDPIEPQNTTPTAGQDAATPKPESSTEQNVTQQQEQPTQPTQQQQSAQPNKNAKPTIAIVAIVVLVMIIIVGIGIAILIPQLNKKPTTSSNTATESTDTTTTDTSNDTNTPTDDTESSEPSSTSGGVQGTVADKQLQLDIIKYIATAEIIRGNEPDASGIQVVSVVQVDSNTSQYVEEWTVDVNGQLPVYTVTIKPDSAGGSNFTVVRKK